MLTKPLLGERNIYSFSKLEFLSNSRKSQGLKQAKLSPEPMIIPPCRIHLYPGFEVSKLSKARKGHFGSVANMVTYVISIDHTERTKAAAVLNRKVLMLCSIAFHMYSLNIFSLNFMFLYSQLVIPLTYQETRDYSNQFQWSTERLLTKLQIYFLIVVCEI